MKGVVKDVCITCGWFSAWCDIEYSQGFGVLFSTWFAAWCDIRHGPWWYGEECDDECGVMLFILVCCVILCGKQNDKI